MTPPSSLRDVHSIIIDIDGVLWQGKDVLPGVVDFFDFLHSAQIRFVIATNNSARPASDVVDRIARLGITVDKGQVLTSAQATAMFLPRIVPRGSRVLVVGGKGLSEELIHGGYELVESKADAVIAGLDPDFTYERLRRATREIRNGARFVGTNGDRTFPGSDGLAPGAGAILAAIEAATDVHPLVIGKPERAMFDVALELLASNPENTAVLGDRLDTDIEGARRSGLLSLLVLTGVTTAEMLEHTEIRPDLVFGDLIELVDVWQKYLQTY